MSYNRCKDIHKFGNKYLPSAYKTQVEFRSHFSGKKSVSYGPRNTVLRTCELWPQTHYPSHHQLYFWRTCSGGICIPAVCVIILRWILPERRNCWQFLLHKFIKGVYSFGRFRKKCWQDTWSFEKKKKNCIPWLLLSSAAELRGASRK